jgi:hypothetical protein
MQTLPHLNSLAILYAEQASLATIVSMALTTKKGCWEQATQTQAHPRKFGKTTSNGVGNKTPKHFLWPSWLAPS